MKLPQIALRDLFWATALVAVLLGWWTNSSTASRESALILNRLTKDRFQAQSLLMEARGALARSEHECENSKHELELLTAALGAEGRNIRWVYVRYPLEIEAVELGEATTSDENARATAEQLESNANEQRR